MKRYEVEEVEIEHGVWLLSSWDSGSDYIRLRRGDAAAAMRRFGGATPEDLAQRYGMYFHHNQEQGFSVRKGWLVTLNGEHVGADGGVEGCVVDVFESVSAAATAAAKAAAFFAIEACSV